MKKVLIITIYDNKNNGNRLQNYAVYNLLKGYNIDVINLKNDRHFNYNDINFISYVKFLFSKFKLSRIERMKYGCRYYSERRKNFQKFSEKINTTNDFFSYNNLSKYDCYDYLVVGSDQVWNPDFALDDLYLLTGFEHGKKIAFTASFGVSELDLQNKKRVSNALKSFSSISVREKAGKKIVESILPNCNCEVLIDPTMLIDASEWEQQIVKPKYDCEKNYILVAFLGKADQKLLLQLDEFAKKYNYKIIDLYREKQCWCSCGPSEFLYLERNASLICTDSFHSAVFGILFNVPLLIANRKDVKQSMDSRIDTLLKTFELEHLRYSGQIDDNILNTNFDKANKILERERKRAHAFLEKALDIKAGE